MNTTVCTILRLVVAVCLAGCAGQTERSLQQPAPGEAQPPAPAPAWT